MPVAKLFTILLVSTSNIGKTICYAELDIVAIQKNIAVPNSLTLNVLFVYLAYSIYVKKYRNSFRKNILLFRNYTSSVLFLNTYIVSDKQFYTTIYYCLSKEIKKGKLNDTKPKYIRKDLSRKIILQRGLFHRKWK